MPKQALGMWWSEAAIAVFAVGAGVAALFIQTAARPAIIFLSVGTLVHFLIYSLIAYKTPWLMLLPWALCALLAGCSAQFITSSKSAARITVGVAVIAALIFQGSQAIKASTRFANDSRNPYAYVPTSKDVFRIEKWMTQLDAKPVAVIGSSYWPLPWYLRGTEKIGYWAEPIEEHLDFPVIFAMPEAIDASDALLGETHTKLPRSLRANVPVVMYVKNELWEHWLEGTSDE